MLCVVADGTANHLPFPPSVRGGLLRPCCLDRRVASLLDINAHMHRFGGKLETANLKHVAKTCPKPSQGDRLHSIQLHLGHVCVAGQRCVRRCTHRCKPHVDRHQCLPGFFRQYFADRPAFTCPSLPMRKETAGGGIGTVAARRSLRQDVAAPQRQRTARVYHASVYHVWRQTDDYEN